MAGSLQYELLGDASDLAASAQSAAEATEDVEEAQERLADRAAELSSTIEAVEGSFADYRSEAGQFASATEAAAASATSLTDATEELGDTLPGVSKDIDRIGSEALETNAQLQVLRGGIEETADAADELDGQEISPDVGATGGGADQEGIRELDLSRLNDEAVAVANIFRRLPPAVQGTIAAATAATAALAGGAGLAAAATVVANKFGDLDVQRDIQSGVVLPFKSAANAFSDAFEPVIRNTVIPALQSLATKLRRSSDELARFSQIAIANLENTFDLVQFAVNPLGEVGQMFRRRLQNVGVNVDQATSFPIRPREESGGGMQMPAGAQAAQGVLQSVRRQLDKSIRQAEILRQAGADRLEMTKMRVSALQKARDQAAKLAANFEAGSAQARLIGQFIENLNRRLQTAQQTAKNLQKAIPLPDISVRNQPIAPQIGKFATSVTELTDKLTQAGLRLANAAVRLKENISQTKTEAKALRAQFNSLLSTTGVRLAQEKRVKRQLEAQVKALKNANRLAALRDQAIDFQQVQPARRTGPIGPPPQVLQDIQAIFGQTNVMKQYQRQLQEVTASQQALNQAIRNTELAGSDSELGRRLSEATKQATKEGTAEGLSTGARIGANAFQGVMSTAISEITRQIENDFARAITSAVLQALSSAAVERLRTLLEGGGGSGGGGSAASSGSSAAGGGSGGGGLAGGAGAAGPIGLLQLAAAGNRAISELFGDVEGPGENILATLFPPIFGAGKLLDFFAEGGQVNSPLQVVGERGPELAALPQGSRVVSNQEAKEMVRQATRSTAVGPTPTGSQRKQETVHHVHEFETEIKRLSGREIGLVIREANSTRKQFGYTE